MYRVGSYSRATRNVRYPALKRGRRRTLLVGAILAGIIFFADKIWDRRLRSDIVRSPLTSTLKIPLETPSDVSSAPLELPPSTTVNQEGPEWELKPSGGCEKSAPFLLIFITSHPANTESREVIRKTWCRRKSYPKNRTVFCVFLLGRPDDDDVAEESSQMSDILKSDFVDHFRNSSKKLRMGLDWMARFCRGARYVMKTEDDVIVNVNVLINEFLTVEKNVIIGKCWVDQPIRNPRSRYYISESAYPNPEYPEYCSGSGYVMSGDVAIRLKDSSIMTNVFPFDEIYVGILLEKIRVKPKNVPGFLIGRFDESEPCVNVTKAVAIHVHGMDMQYVWRLIRDCSNGK